MLSIHRYQNQNWTSQDNDKGCTRYETFHFVSDHVIFHRSQAIDALLRLMFLLLSMDTVIMSHDFAYHVLILLEIISILLIVIGNIADIFDIAKSIVYITVMMIILFIKKCVYMMKEKRSNVIGVINSIFKHKWLSIILESYLFIDIISLEFVSI